MRLKFLCPQCLIEHEHVVLGYSDLGSVELTNNYCYDYTCPKGHTTNVFVQNPRYELLYDFGVSAYLDGYYREAVLDFAAALERFYEHAIYSLVGIKGASDNMKNFWNHIKKQSERQLGAFLALYFAKYGDAPELPSNKQIEFRNNVTHKGYFPSKEETEEYAKFVGSYIVRMSKILPDDMDAHFASLYPALEEMKKSSAQRGGHNIVSVVSLLKSGKNFEESVIEFQKFFGLFYSK